MCLWHAASCNSSLLGLYPLLLQGLLIKDLRLLLQLLKADLLTLVAGGGPLNHLHGVQVAVGGLAVHCLLDDSLGGVGWLALLHLLLFPRMLLCVSNITMCKRAMEKVGLCSQDTFDTHD